MIRRLIPLGPLLALFTACDIPTNSNDLPSWDVMLRVPAIRTTVGTEDIIDDTKVTIQDSLFVFDDVSNDGEVSVTEVCPSCVAADGFPTLYDPFVHRDTLAFDFDGDFHSAYMVDGQIEVRLQHSFPYPVLRNESGATGSLEIALLDGNTVMKTAWVDGKDRAFASGAANSLLLSLDLEGVTLKPAMRIAVTISSPGSGSTYPMDTAAALDYLGSTRTLHASSVLIDAPRSVSEQAEIEIEEDLSGDLHDNILEAMLNITIQHPYPVDSQIEISLYANHQDAELGENPVATRSFVAKETQAVYSMVLTAEQMRTLLHHDGEDESSYIIARFDATVGLPGDLIHVTPADQVHVDVGLDIALLINDRD